jgi:hypothetical protein
MVVEGVPARPVQQPDVGVHVAAAVVVERLPRVQQHVGDPSDRDKGVDRVVPLRQGRQADGVAAGAYVPGRAVPVRNAPAREAGLTDHGREHDSGPRRLLPEPRPLQRPADVDERAPVDEPVRDATDGLRRDVRHGLRPLRRPRLAARLAEQVALERLVAGAVGGQEAAIGEALGRQHVGDAEHDGDVRPGRGDSQVAPGSETSLRTGLRYVTSTPRSASRCIWSRSPWPLLPPGVTCAFLSGMPPKHRRNSVFSSITRHPAAPAMTSRCDP